MIDWSWVAGHGPLFLRDTAEHAYLSLLPVLIGLAVSLPVGVACVRFPRLAPPVLAATTVLYTIPAIALFALLINYTALSRWTVVIPLALYSLSILVRGVIDGLRNVPEAVRGAATAMGYGGVRRLVAVELPMALPLVAAALRVAAVSSISLLAVGALIGDGALGQLFLTGYQVGFPTEIAAGVVLIVALAFAVDLTLAGLQRVLTPWAPARPGRSSR